MKELPGLAAGALSSRQWAGLVTVDAAIQGKLFYWLFEAEEAPQSKPLLIWLNGGPGCSSMDGLFLENGPFKIDDQQTITVNPYGWHKVRGEPCVLTYFNLISIGFGASTHKRTY